MSHSTENRIAFVRIKHRVLQDRWIFSSDRRQPLDALADIHPRVAGKIGIRQPLMLLHRAKVPPANVDDLPHALAIRKPPQLGLLDADPRREILAEPNPRACVPRLLLPLRVLFVSGPGGLCYYLSALWFSIELSFSVTL